MANKTRVEKIQEIARFVANPELYKIIIPETMFGEVLVCESGKGVVRSYSKTNYSDLRLNVTEKQIDQERQKLIESV